MATQSRFYSSAAVDNTLGNSGGISNSATSLYCATSPTGYPGQFPWTLVLDEGTINEELVQVNAGSGTQGTPWQVTRGFDGTLARTHAQGCQLGHRSSGFDFTTSRLHEVADSSVSNLPHGLPAAAWQIGSYAVINELLLTNSTTATVTWSSLPQGYAHLMVVISARSTYTGAQLADVGATINSDTSAVYSNTTLDIQNTTGTLAGPTANTRSAGTNWPWFFLIAAAQAGAATNIGSGFAIIPNYSGTTHNKSFQSMSGFGNGSTAAMATRLRWGWYNPSAQVAITSLTIAVSNGFFLTGAFLGLYGLGG